MTARKLRTFEEKITVFMNKFAWKEEDSPKLFHTKYPYVSEDEIAELFKLSKEMYAAAYTFVQPRFQRDKFDETVKAEARADLAARYPYLETDGIDQAVASAFQKAWRESFFAEVAVTFRFLETQYGYKRLEEKIEYPGDPRDTTMVIKYISSHVGVAISWYPEGGSIRVSFVECLQPGIYPERATCWLVKDRSDLAKFIDLYCLAEMQGQSEDPDLLLKEDSDYRRATRRSKIIQARMSDVIAGLARATQTYAASILQGDTTSFPHIMKFYALRYKRLHPTASLPLGLVDEE